MFKLLSRALGRGKSEYLKFCSYTRVLVIVICAVAGVLNFGLALSVGTNGNFWGSYTLYIGVFALTAGMLVWEQLFPYAKIARTQLDMWYLSEHNPIKEERYIKQILEEFAPLKKVERIAFFGFYGAVTAACVILAITLGAGAVKAYAILLVVFTCVPIIWGVAWLVVFFVKRGKVLKDNFNAAVELGSSQDKEWKNANGSPLRPKNREVELKLQFSDNALWHQYRTGRIIFIVFTVVAFAVLFIPLPIVLGNKSVVGIVTIFSLFFAFLGGAFAGHIVESNAIRKSRFTQPDTTAGNYRKILSGAHLEYYRHWGRMCACVLLALGVFLGLICLLQYFGIVTIDTISKTSMGNFLYVAAPLWFLMLLTIGIDTWSGWSAFKADFVYFSRALTLSQDII